MANCISCTASISEVPYAALPGGYGSYVWACDLSSPRQIIRASTGEMLVATSNSITCLWDDNNNGFSDPNERATIISQSGLNHGVVIQGGYIYASSPSTVYRWALSSSGIRTPLSNPETIVSGIPSTHHITRTMIFDSNGLLYVQCGSGSNVDPNPDRSIVRRFDLTQASSFNYTDGEVFAYGMRNEVGLRFDAQGGLWGVENGVDDLTRDGVDIHNDNPGEELNYFGTQDNTPGLFYGYPYCYSALNISGIAPLTQLVHPNFENIGNYSDAWCQDTSNVVLPKLLLPAHNAPLDIIFYNGTTFSGVNNGDAFVSLHGSWDRNPPSGYRVVKVSFSGGVPVSFEPFWSYNSTTSQNDQTQWPYRPVGLAFGNCHTASECLYVTDDANGMVFSIVPQTVPSDASQIMFASVILLLCFLLI